jgi:hypothetical protein
VIIAHITTLLVLLIDPMRSDMARPDHFRYILADKFRKMKRSPGVVVFVTFVALRWLRLTPVYAFVLFFDTWV